MKLFLASISAVALSFFSCVTPAPSSSWPALKEASPISCSPWPLHEGDLEISRIDVASPEDPYLLAQGRSRYSLPVRYWAKFRGGISLSPSSAVEIPLGKGAVVAGGMTLGGVPHVVIVRSSSSQAFVEVRTIRDNIVRATSQPLPFAIRSATLTRAGEGFWLVYERTAEGPDYSLEDPAAETQYGIAYLNRAKDGQLSLRELDTGPLESAPLVLHLPQSDVSEALVVYTTTDDSARKTPFRYRLIREGAEIAPERSLDLAVSDRLESWTASTSHRDLALAWVDGDTLVGQATLRAAKLSVSDAGLSVSASSELTLTDVHASEPLWMSRANGKNALFLLQWMDDEGSIGVYTLEDNTLKGPRYVGVLPRGARVMDTLFAPGQDEVFATIRYRDDAGGMWKFDLCDLGSL